MAKSGASDVEMEDVDYYEDDPKLTALLRWMRIHGYANEYGVRIQDTPIGRGAIATKPIKEGNVMLVHKKLFLSDDSQEIGPEGKVGRAVRKHVKEDLEILALFLFYERYIRKENSFWWPWIDILPEEMTHTVFFSEEELEELKGSAVQGMTQSLTQQLEQTWEQYKTWFVPELWPEEEFTFERYKWALATSWARTFMLTMKRNLDPPENGEVEEILEDNSDEDSDDCDSDGSAVLFEDDDDDDPTTISATADSSASVVAGSGKKKKRKRKPEERHVTAFIPFADMLNYRPSDVCGGEMTYREDYFRIWSNRNVSQGEQLYVEYGNKGNTELLLYYGFVIPGNPFSTIKIAFDIDKEDPHHKWKQERLKSAINLEPYHVDESTLWYEVPVYQGDPSNELPDRVNNGDSLLLMPFLRVYVANTPADRRDAQRSLFHPLSPDNERKALETLQNKCQRLLQSYPTTIAEDEKLIATPTPGLSPRRFQARMARLEEKRILLSVVERTTQLLKDDAFLKGF